jgi:hypothetical protein
MIPWAVLISPARAFENLSEASNLNFIQLQNIWLKNS